MEPCRLLTGKGVMEPCRLLTEVLWGTQILLTVCYEMIDRQLDP